MMNLNSKSADIAIIGMSCRVAGADSPSKFWENLVVKRDVRRRVNRFNIDGYYNAQGETGKGLTNVQDAYFIDQDVERFDNAFFSISPVEASAIDPQHRILLEVAYEAIENAGIPLQNIQGTDTAVYAGNAYHSPKLSKLNKSCNHHKTGNLTYYHRNLVQ